jgi:hypothetical protein
MGIFLRNLALLAGITAAGGFALMKAAGPSRSPALSPPPLIVAHEPPPSSIHSPIRFAALIEGDEIHVRYASRGCFHDFEHNLVFSSAPGGSAALTHATSRSNLLQGYRFVTPSRLSPAELRQLDALLSYYRAPRNDGMCTTRDSVSVALYHDGTLIATEHFIDGTCGFRPDDNALTFDRLVHIAPLVLR